MLPPVSVELVRIDVVVTDKGGHPRPGLAREDFAVFEDGQLQTLAQFEAYSRRLPGTPPAPSTPAVAAAEEPARPRPPRFVVLAVDDFHIEFGNLVRAKKALTRFVEEDVGPEDRVALVTTSGAVSQELTTDRDVLRQAISRLSARQARWWMDGRALHLRVPGRADRAWRPGRAGRGRGRDPAGAADATPARRWRQGRRRVRSSRSLSTTRGRPWEPSRT